MKRKLFLVVLVLGLMLTACGSASRLVEVKTQVVGITQGDLDGIVKVKFKIVELFDKYPNPGYMDGLSFSTIFDATEFSAFNVGDEVVLICRTSRPWYEIIHDSCFIKP